jgi:hypothetical protein
MSMKYRRADVFCFTDLVSIQYRDNDGGTKSGVISVELEFSPSDLSINYLSVDYIDPELERRADSNPNVLRNIDSYLRNKLLKLDYKF